MVFEPAFYFTDLPDWGTSYLLAQKLGPQAKAMVQSILNIQTAYAKALLVDRPALRQAQEDNDVLAGYRILQAAYETDVSSLLAEVRRRQGLEPDPIAVLRASGYMELVAQERGLAHGIRNE